MGRTFVVAEAAACHDRDVGKAYQLIGLAQRIGADAVKFQWVSSAKRLAERRNAQDYQSAYETLEFPVAWLADFRRVCDRVGIEFMCTVYLPEDIPVIAPLVQRFKIASFEAEDVGFLRAHVPYHKPLIISAGMAGVPGHVHGDAEVYWLHCISAYPAPVEQMNLRILRKEGSPYDGLSDHSRHPWTGALAVAAGADIVEFHIRLQVTSPTNADYAVARTPDEAHDYVQNIRLAEVMLGDGISRVMPCEEPMRKYRVSP